VDFIFLTLKVLQILKGILVNFFFEHKEEARLRYLRENFWSK